MGTWSHEPFGNDSANDWAYELEHAADLSYVETALDAVLKTKGYLEAREASCAIAAVEVIAKLLGKGTQCDTYTEKIDEWVKDVHAKPSPLLLEKARRALERISSKKSELNELWRDADADVAAEWQGSVKSLLAIVSA